MKTKAAVFIMLVLMTIFNTGCFAGNPGKTTGFRYVLDSAKYSAIQKPAGQGGTAGQETSIRQQSPIRQEIPTSHELRNDTATPNEAGPVSKDPPASSPAKEPPAVPAKTVYLTFDDGPNDIETPMILDILDSYGVKGTFFVVGTSIERFQGVLKDIVRRGHAIGNHTYDHKYSEVYASNAAFMESIKKNEELIFRIAGQRPKIVRDPGGEVRNNKVLKDLLAQNGYTLVDWNIDSYDSRKPSLDGARLVESVRLQAANAKIWSHMVILMHDGRGHLNTVRALPTIIELLKHEGFQFATLE